MTRDWAGSTNEATLRNCIATSRNRNCELSVPEAMGTTAGATHAGPEAASSWRRGACGAHARAGPAFATLGGGPGGVFGAGRGALGTAPLQNPMRGNSWSVTTVEVGLTRFLCLLGGRHLCRSCCFGRWRHLPPLAHAKGELVLLVVDVDVAGHAPED